MPTRLPNGLVIFNATKHDIHFQFGDEIVTAPYDITLSAKPVFETVEVKETYTLVTASELPTYYGQDMIRYIHDTYPGALIIGSVIAARAYPGEILQCVLMRKTAKNWNSKTLLVRPDMFITYKKEQ